VAVLLELARILPEATRPYVEIVLFDAEDSGNIEFWDWIVGSNYYVSQMSETQIERTEAMILADMVGDTNLTLLKETSSTDSLQNTVWNIAAGLGYSNAFLNSYGSSILDDHRPFLDVGIPSLDIIQHNPFPWYWHTLEDTPDKCSATSLEMVGQVIETFVVSQVNTGGIFPFDPPYLLLGIVALVIVLAAIGLYPRIRKG
jgi:Zn-dependent M28 family amino/carboxypeptidase